MFMKGLEDYLYVYLVVQAIGIAFLIAAFRNTRTARWMLSLLFLYAGVHNMYIGIASPDTYLEFSKLSLGFYSSFIDGWFSRYNHIMIPAIAAGQLLIGTGMLLRDWWVKWSCIGAIIFLVSIIPLMVGSGFPFSITVSLAAYLVLVDDDRRFIWTKRMGMKKSANRRQVRLT
jgi:hypothetical protein